MGPKTPMNVLLSDLSWVSMSMRHLSVNYSSRIVIYSMKELVKVLYNPSMDFVAISLAYIMVRTLSKSILKFIINAVLLNLILWRLGNINSKDQTYHEVFRSRCSISNWDS